MLVNSAVLVELLDAMKQLNKQKIKTYAFVGPLLPHFVTEPKILEKVFSSIKTAGTTELYVEHINLSSYILDRFCKEMPDLDKYVMEKFYMSKNKDYRESLSELVLKLVEKYEFKLRLGSAIYHKEL